MSKVLRTEINLKEKFRLPKKLLSVQTSYLSLALRIRPFCLSNLELTKKTMTRLEDLDSWGQIEITDVQ